MSKQPDALALAIQSNALADEQECIHLVSWVEIRNLLRADAAELRRLHALLVEAKPMLEEFGGTPAYDLIDRIDALGEGEKK